MIAQCSGEKQYLLSVGALTLQRQTPPVLLGPDSRHLGAESLCETQESALTRLTCNFMHAKL